jgi:hypothetical protein
MIDIARRQESRHSRDVICLADPPQGNVLEERLELGRIAQQLCVDRRSDRRRRDAVDGDAKLSPSSINR